MLQRRTEEGDRELLSEEHCRKHFHGYNPSRLLPIPSESASQGTQQGGSRRFEMERQERLEQFQAYQSKEHAQLAIMRRDFLMLTGGLEILRSDERSKKKMKFILEYFPLFVPHIHRLFVHPD